MFSFWKKPVFLILAIPGFQAFLYWLFGTSFLFGTLSAPFTLNSDNYRFVLPKLAAISDSFSKGQWPFWNPYESGGVDLITVGGKPFFGSLLLLVFSPLDTMVIVGLIHTFLALFFFYLLARHLKLSSFSAVIGAVIWAYSAYHLWYLYDIALTGTTLWIPLQIYCLLRFLQGKQSTVWIVLAAFSLSVQIFYGRPPDIFYSLISVSIFYFAHVWKHSGQAEQVWLQRLKTGVLPMVLIVLLGLGLAAFFILPMFDHLMMSYRLNGDSPYNPTIQRGFDRVLELFLPNLRNESMLFIGMSQVPLLLLSFKHANTLLRRTAVMLMVFSLMCIFPLGLFDLLRKIPGHSAANVSYRLLPMLFMATAILSAMGFEVLWDSRHEARHFFAKLVMIYLPRALGWPALIYLCWAWFNGKDYWSPVLVLMSSLLAFELGWRFWRQKNGHGLFLCFVLSLMVGYVAANHGDTSDGEDPKRFERYFSEQHHGELIKFLKSKVSEAAPFRVISIAEGIPFFTLPAFHGIETAQTYESSPLYLNKVITEEIRKGTSPQAFIDIYNIRYLITPGGGAPDWVKGSCDLVKTTDQKRFDVYENKDFLPRAYLAETVQVIDHLSGQLEWLRSKTQGLKREALVESPIEAKIGAKGKVEFTSITPNQIKLRVENEDPSLLVIGNTLKKGWEATMNGESIPLMRANVAFQACHLPEGNHDVVLEYTPRWLFTGLWISALALLFSLSLLLPGVRKRLFS